jgi:hypothetical protein
MITVYYKAVKYHKWYFYRSLSEFGGPNGGLAALIQDSNKGMLNNLKQPKHKHKL